MNRYDIDSMLINGYSRSYVEHEEEMSAHYRQIEIMNNVISISKVLAIVLLSIMSIIILINFIKHKKNKKIWIILWIIALIVLITTLVIGELQV